jgi:hypothetical protein
MSRGEYNLVGRQDLEEGYYLKIRRLSFVQRLRLIVGGTLFTCLGFYVIWKALLLLGYLFARPTTELQWDTIRYGFFL